MIPEADRTLIVSEQIYLRLEDMAAEERKKEKCELLRELKTWKALAQKLLKEGVKS